MKKYFIILLAGSSTRTNMDIDDNKCLIKNNQLKSPLEQLLDTLHLNLNIDIIVIVYLESMEYVIQEILKSNNYNKVHFLIPRKPSKIRFISTKLAINKIEKHLLKDDIILIHDGSRPYISNNLINRLLERITFNENIDGVAPAILSYDALKYIKNNRVIKNVNINDVQRIQTPQVFKALVLVETIKNIPEKNYKDDVEAVLTHNKNANIVTIQGEITNKKITYKSDVLQWKNQNYDGKVAIGKDAHPYIFTNEKNIIKLGGYKIIYKIDNKYISLKALSDGDVLLHSLSNSLSSLCNKGSIGTYGSPLFKKGVTNSKYYLYHILRISWIQGYKIQNISFSVDALKPKLEQYRTKIIKSLKNILLEPRKQYINELPKWLNLNDIFDEKIDIGLTFSTLNNVNSYKGITSTCYILAQKNICIKVKSYAKINRRIKMIKKLKNGYHQFITNMNIIDLKNHIYITSGTPETKVTYSYYTNQDLKPHKQENDLCFHIIQSLKDKFIELKKINIHVHIDRYIPFCAGLGGSSADASTLLLTLNVLWDLKLTQKDLLDIGGNIGADLPFFILGHANLELIQPYNGTFFKKNSYIKDLIIIKLKNTYITTKEQYDIYDIKQFPSHNNNDITPAVYYAFPHIKKFINRIKKYNLKNVYITGVGPSIVIEIEKNEYDIGKKLIDDNIKDIEWFTFTKTMDD
jgi:4-diphosphocytidyl-2C-methyl-D-erythritol kinase